MKTRRAPGRSTLGREVCSGLNSIQVERETALEKTDRCSLGYKLVFNQGKNVVSNTRFTNAPTSGSLLARAYDTFDAYRLDADALPLLDPTGGPRPTQKARNLGRIVVR